MSRIDTYSFVFSIQPFVLKLEFGGIGKKVPDPRALQASGTKGLKGNVDFIFLSCFPQAEVLGK